MGEFAFAGVQPRLAGGHIGFACGEGRIRLGQSRLLRLGGRESEFGGSGRLDLGFLKPFQAIGRQRLVGFIQAESVR